MVNYNNQNFLNVDLNQAMKEKLKRFLTSFYTFQVRDYSYDVTIEEGISFKENLSENKVWSRGVPKELEQFYSMFTEVDKTSFWGSSSMVENIRKIHIDLPNLMIKTLTDITVNDLRYTDITNEQYKEIWNQIENDNKFNKSLNKILKQVLTYGDGAFKISFKPDMMDVPVIDFIPAENVDYIVEDGRIKETVFKKTFKDGEKKFFLMEFYGFGYVKYVLVDENFVEYPLNTIPALKNLKDIVFLRNDGRIDNSINLAIPFKIWESEIYENRGKSIFDGKKQSFDALDEVYSQFIDAMRKGRVQRYIPDCMIPKDKNGNLLMKNDFANTYISLQTPNLIDQNQSYQVQLIEPELQVEKYEAAYSIALSDCLQGWISPSTLGIDSDKVNENATAEREKERVTLFSRDNIVEQLTYVMQEVIETSIRFYCYQMGIAYNDDYEISITFGQYASPSFDSQVETLSKAAPGKQILTFEQIQKEFYPDMPEEELMKVVEELKRLNGVGVEMDYLNLFNDNNDLETTQEFDGEESVAGDNRQDDLLTAL